jgi:hypothetical protein
VVPDLLIRAGVATNRDELLRSVKFGVVRAGEGLREGATVGPRPDAALGEDRGERIEAVMLPECWQCARFQRERRGPCRRLGTRECAALVIAYGLLDFLSGVHNERAVLHDRLAERTAGENEESRAFGTGGDLDAVAVGC